MSRGLSVRAATVALAIVAGSVGCGSGDMVAPRARAVAAPTVPTHQIDKSKTSNSDESEGAPGNRSVSLVTCAPHAALFASGVFGPGGGTLVFGNSRLIIPAGALHATVTISATVAAGTSSRVDFAPSGLQFDKPAGLVLSTSGCALPTQGIPSVVSLGSDGLVLESIAVVYDPQGKTLAAPILHFSGYAIAF